MKKNLLALCAISFSVLLSSFTAKFSTDYYLVYNSGTEKNMSSYNTPTTTVQSHVYNPLTPGLNWIKVIDDDGTPGVSVTEFNRDFEIYDVVSDGSDLLTDETADISGSMDLKEQP